MDLFLTSGSKRSISVETKDKFFSIFFGSIEKFFTTLTLSLKGPKIFSLIIKYTFVELPALKEPEKSSLGIIISSPLFNYSHSRYHLFDP